MEEPRLPLAASGMFGSRASTMPRPMSSDRDRDADPRLMSATERERHVLDLQSKYLRTGRDHVGQQREKWRVCDKFLAGHQWDPEVESALKAQSRAPLTVNRINRYVHAVTGFEVKNRQRALFMPRVPERPETSGAADLANSVYQWALDECHGDDERSRAFKDMINRGVGFTGEWIDTEADAEGKFMLERIDGFEMYWDPAARKANLEDSNWFMRRRWVRLEDVEARWPDKKDMVAVNGDASDLDVLDMPLTIENRGSDLYRPDGQKVTPGDYALVTEGYVLVTEMQWRERDTIYRTKDPVSDTDEIVTLTSEEWKILQRRFTNGTPKHVKQQVWVYKRAFICRGVVLQEGDAPIQTGFSLRALTYLWDPEDKVWYGLTDLLIDPQKGSNKYISQAIAIFSTSPKGALLVEAEAVLNPTRLADQWASPGGIVTLRAGAITGKKYDVAPTAPLSTAAVSLAQIFMSGFREASGIDLDLLGANEGDQAGVTMRQREQQQLSILAVAFEALRRYRMVEAKQVIAWVREFLADGRIIRIGGPFSAQFVPLLKDPLLVQMDVTIDDSPDNPHKKMEVWQTLQPIIPVLIRNGLFVPELLDYAPLPQTIIHAVKQRMDQIDQQQQEMAKQGIGPDGKPAGGGGKAPEDPRLTEAKIAELGARAMLTVERAKAIAQESELEVGESGVRSKDTMARLGMELLKMIDGLEGSVHERRMREDDAGHEHRQGNVKAKAALVAALNKGIGGKDGGSRTTSTERAQERLDDVGYPEL